VSLHLQKESIEVDVYLVRRLRDAIKPSEGDKISRVLPLDIVSLSSLSWVRIGTLLERPVYAVRRGMGQTGRTDFVSCAQESAK
jgi:hypothetical protein